MALEKEAGGKWETMNLIGVALCFYANEDLYCYTDKHEHDHQSLIIFGKSFM